MLNIQNLRKRFGATQALADLSLTAPSGCITALLGENGAGKSTAMHIVAGLLPPDAGRMQLNGQPFAPRNPAQARRAGVCLVHQERMLALDLGPAENIMLGAESSRCGWLQHRRTRVRAHDLLEQLCPPARARSILNRPTVRQLAAADQQLVEIARALASPALRVLILDEPTSSLDREDAERLFELLSTLRQRGLAILYISHFLEEVSRIADHYTTLRDGTTVAAGPVRDADPDLWIAQMAGASQPNTSPPASAADNPPQPSPSPPESPPALPLPDQPRQFQPRPGPNRPVLLSVCGLRASPLPHEAHLELHAGEILGIGGLVGAGRSELLRAIFGLTRPLAGESRIGALPAPRSPAQAWRMGIGLLSEDRKTDGLLLDLGLADNLTLPDLPSCTTLGYLSRARQARALHHHAHRLHIRHAGPHQPARSLSGGNQQKLALARLFHARCSILLLDEPTRGVDVRSKQQIYHAIREQARAGGAILLVSSYWPELLALADRIAIMRHGRLGPAKPATQCTAQSMLAEAIGAPTSPPP